MNISFQKVNPDDKKIINLIADWYLQEWNIAKDQTIQKLSDFLPNSILFQLL